MTHVHSRTSMTHLNLGWHLCFLPEDEKEHRAVVTPYILHGLERNEKVTYLLHTRSRETILGYLSDAGVSAEAYLQTGQLSLRNADDTFFREGGFEPRASLKHLRREIEAARNEGYQSLRITSEMSWAMQGAPGSQYLIEYEARLNSALRDAPFLGLCQYERGVFPPSVLLYVLATHPHIVSGAGVQDNPYYMIPPPFLTCDSPSAILEQWLDNLSGPAAARDPRNGTVPDSGSHPLGGHL